MPPRPVVKKIEPVEMQIEPLEAKYEPISANVVSVGSKLETTRSGRQKKNEVVKIAIPSTGTHFIDHSPENHADASDKNKTSQVSSRQKISQK